MLRPKAIDCWLNPSFRASDYRPDFLVRTLRDAMHMDGSADTYGDLMWTEGYIVMVLLAFAGIFGSTTR